MSYSNISYIYLRYQQYVFQYKAANGVNYS